jgi:hypothetical protein
MQRQYDEFDPKKTGWLRRTLVPGYHPSHDGHAPHAVDIGCFIYFGATNSTKPT